MNQDLAMLEAPGLTMTSRVAVIAVLFALIALAAWLEQRQRANETPEQTKRRILDEINGPRGFRFFRMRVSRR